MGLFGNSTSQKISRLEQEIASIKNALSAKVDKISGKGLSANDFTNAYKTKLDSIGSEAVEPAVVASGDYVTPQMYGAKVHLVSKEEGGFKRALELVEEFAEENGAYRPLQFDNELNVEGQYVTTGQEIIDTIPDVNAFVSGIGTGGTLMGIGKRLKDHNPDAKVFALEPSTLSILKMGMDEGSHMIEGIGDDFIPGIVDEDLIDDIVLIHDCDAINMSKKLACELGLGVGISSGANFLASVIMDNDDLKMATVFPDDNKKYITTKLSEPIDDNPELISNKIKLIGFEVL